MPGRVIYMGKEPHTCDTPLKKDRGPRPSYPPGTIWQCDECSHYWEVSESGFSWKKVTEQHARRVVRHAEKERGIV